MSRMEKYGRAAVQLHEAQTVLAALIISSPKGLTVRQLQRDFINETGVDLPYRDFGSATFENFLLTIPETCELIGNGDYALVKPVTNEHNRHIDELVSKQKKKPLAPFQKPPLPRPNSVYRGRTEQEIEQEKLKELKKLKPTRKKEPRELEVIEEVEEVDEQSEPDSEKEWDRILQECLGPFTPPPSQSSDDDSFDYEEMRRQAEIEKESKQRVEKSVRDNLEDLTFNHPEGIWLSNLSVAYYVEYKTPLDPFKYGYCSLYELCTDLPHVVYLTRPYNFDYKVYCHLRPWPTYQLPDDYKYPDCIMMPEDRIERQWISPDTDVGSYISVFVSQVNTPRNIWIQLINHHTSVELDAMMDHMRLYYMDNAGALRITGFSLHVGMACAALYKNVYHRALVVQNFVDGSTEVFYIDYGNTAIVKTEKLCFLHKDFGKLPQQAIRAKLANTFPVSGDREWDPEASKLLLDLTSGKDICAYIAAIDTKYRILSLILTDTTNESLDIHINDALSQAGYALLAPEDEYEYNYTKEQLEELAKQQQTSTENPATENSKENGYSEHDVTENGNTEHDVIENGNTEHDVIENGKSAHNDTENNKSDNGVTKNGKSEHDTVNGKSDHIESDAASSEAKETEIVQSPETEEKKRQKMLKLVKIIRVRGSKKASGKYVCPIEEDEEYLRVLNS